MSQAIYYTYTTNRATNYDHHSYRSFSILMHTLPKITINDVSLKLKKKSFSSHTDTDRYRTQNRARGDIIGSQPVYTLYC